MNCMLKVGSTEHLKNAGYWIDDYDTVKTLDGLFGFIVGDYTNLKEYPHVIFKPWNLPFEVGISPEYINGWEKQERDMEERNINEAMAGLEGYVFEEVRQNGARYPYSQNGFGKNSYPKYTTDHNAVQRVIDGLSDDELRLFWNHCAPVVGGWDWMFPRATALQKCEAILRAKGLWEE